MHNAIRHIIFDLGAVLLDIDYQRTIEAFKNLGLPDPQRAFSREHQGDIFKAYEVGAISSLEFLERIRALLPTAVSHRDVQEAWCALLGEMPRERVDMLQSLQLQGYSLYILSNTNAIHQERFEAHIDARYGWANFSGLFERIYYSHKLGLRKPEREIFNFVLHAHNIAPQSAWFIDDTAMHVATAAHLGLHTHVLHEDELLSDIVWAKLG